MPDERATASPPFGTPRPNQAHATPLVSDPRRQRAAGKRPRLQLHRSCCGSAPRPNTAAYRASEIADRYYIWSRPPFDMHSGSGSRPKCKDSAEALRWKQVAIEEYNYPVNDPALCR